MKTVVISQPMYFPWVGLLEQVRLADVWVHLDDAQLSKGGFFNRVQLKSDQGTPWLTVPLAKNRLGQALNEIQLAEHDWRRKHLSTLRQTYAKAPCVDEMLALVEEVFEREVDTLSSLSAASIEASSEYFEIAPSDIRWSSRLRIGDGGSARVLAICRALGAERYVTGHGARDYLDHESFEASGIRVEYMNYEKRPYPQLHRDFTPYVTALDLVANCGRPGREVIASGTVYWKDFLK
jgi:hypothetical protein|tara:strand:+ start:1662 stop:2372 length:711 start_codon:yes stop_codon:yes gene_type:complete